jgi:hypothetical protein
MALTQQEQPPFYQSVSGGASFAGSTVVNLALPASTTAGRLLLLFINSGFVDPPDTIAIDSAFTLIKQRAFNYQLNRLYYRPADGSATEQSIAVTVTQGGASQCGMIYAEIDAHPVLSTHDDYFDDVVTDTVGATAADLTRSTEAANFRMTLGVLFQSGAVINNSDDPSDRLIRALAGGAFTDSIIMTSRNFGDPEPGATYDWNGTPIHGTFSFILSANKTGWVVGAAGMG